MTKRTDFIRDAKSFSQDRLTNPLWRNIAIFTIGLVVGWMVFGWLLFPVKYTHVYPNELHPDALNDYLLMAAESYGATHDLRTAGKRLRYWDDPNVLGPMLNELAQSIETTDPAGAAYLSILARDLHLPATPAPSTQSSSSSPGFNFLILLIPLLALAVLVGLILIAQRFGLLNRGAVQPEIADIPEQMPAPAAPPEDASFTDAAPAISIATISTDEPEEAIEPMSAVEPEAAAELLEMDESDGLSGEMMEDELDFGPGEEPDFSEDAPLADESIDPETPETHSAPPPPIPDEIEMMELGEEEDQQAPRVLRFDGDPAYNTIVAIEPHDDYLGEYGLSASRTAPNNANLVLTLEVWLFDKSDTQTMEITLVPPVIAADPDLKARYVGENASVIPLQEGQPISLDTAELHLDGRVRRVGFGAATSDGVPVIDYAEIELLGRRK